MRTSVATHQGKTTELDGEALNECRMTIRGEVFTLGDLGYEAAQVVGLPMGL